MTNPIDNWSLGLAYRLRIDNFSVSADFFDADAADCPPYSWVDEWDVSPHTDDAILDDH